MCEVENGTKIFATLSHFLNTLTSIDGFDKRSEKLINTNSTANASEINQDSINTTDEPLNNPTEMSEKSK